MRRLPLALLLLLAVAGNAQTRRPRKPAATTPPAAAAERTSWPLETLKVEGNQNYTAAQILAVAQLRVGQTAGKPEFEAARERLVACGAFDRVGYRFAPAKDGQGFDASLEVTEMAQMYPLRFEDLPATDTELRAWLKQQDPLFAPKTPATKLALERYTKLISEFLAQKNYRDPVIAKVVSEGLSDLVILFRPAKARPSVARIKFNNTGEIPAVTLQTAMYGVAIGVGYTEPQIRLLLDSTIRPLYEAKGMIRVSFPKIETEPVKDVEGIMVTIQVEPGPVYKLGKIRFGGVDMSPDELAERANLKGGRR
jgi:outer membrane protein insertion porin family